MTRFRKSHPALLAALIMIGLLAHGSRAQAATETLTVAGGCFWCVESDFESVKGVRSAVSGYTGGKTATRPTRRFRAVGRVITKPCRSPLTMPKCRAIRFFTCSFALLIQPMRAVNSVTGAKAISRRYSSLTQRKKRQQTKRNPTQQARLAVRLYADP